MRAEPIEEFTKRARTCTLWSTRCTISLKLKESTVARKDRWKILFYKAKKWENSKIIFGHDFIGQLFVYTRQTDIRGEIIFLKHSWPTLRFSI
jgi:hypothetical protein